MINGTLRVLSKVTENLPVGTNLGLLPFLWMLVSGALLPRRGALFPALKSIGLSDGATRRAWAAFGQGKWQIKPLVGLRERGGGVAHYGRCNRFLATHAQDGS